MKHKKILMINDHIHFGGGGDAAFQLERKILEEAGHQVFTYSVAGEAPEHSTDKDFIFVESGSRVKQKIGKFIGCPSITKDLKATVDAIKPNLIHLHLMSKYPADTYKALGGYPVIQTLHGPNLFCATSWGALKKDSTECEQGIGVKCYTRGCVGLREIPLYLNLGRRQSKAAKQYVDTFLSPSRQLAETAESLGYKPVKYFPLSIDPGFETLSNVAKDDVPSVLYVGALIEQKGVQFLIEAFRRVVDRLPNAVLRFAGRGVMESFLKQRTQQLSLKKNVEFLGFVGREEVIKHYQRAHVVAVPSIWREQFGLVGPEALACSTPCVGSNIGGIPEWLQDNKSGFLVPPRNNRALGEKISELLEDENLRREFGEYGREFVLEQFSLARHQANILKLIEEYAS